MDRQWFTYRGQVGLLVGTIERDGVRHLCVSVPPEGECAWPAREARRATLWQALCGEAALMALGIRDRL